MGGGGSIKKHTNEQKLFHITVCNCNTRQFKLYFLIFSQKYLPKQ